MAVDLLFVVTSPASRESRLARLAAHVRYPLAGLSCGP